MRNRLEDLGRLLVMLEKLTEREIFELPIRPKDYPDWFLSQPEDNQYNIIHSFVYGISGISDELNEMILIARGHDELNYKEN